MVQTRWAHLNESYSPLTRVQALALDGHFVIEQTGRNRAGLLINFNGSGGVWRRACIEACGRLAVRYDDGRHGSQLSRTIGRMAHALHARSRSARRAAPADGGIQAPAGALGPGFDAMPAQAGWAYLAQRAEPGPESHGNRAHRQLPGAAHDAASAAASLAADVFVVRQTNGLVGWLWVAGLGPPLYTVAQSRLHPNWGRRMLYFPLLAVVTVGITWSTSWAVGKGLSGWGGQFLRTPKFRLEGRSGDWSESRYRLRPKAMTIGEIVLAHLRHRRRGSAEPRQLWHGPVLAAVCRRVRPGRFSSVWQGLGLSTADR